MYCKQKLNQVNSDECGGPIKPNITFFGEDLPEEFEEAATDIKLDREIDLLIVIGTALAVYPFCNIVDLVGKRTPKVLINMSLT